MEAKFTNGAFLHKVWSDTKSAEVLAAFQYMSDAEDMAELAIVRDQKHQLGSPFYVVTCTYSGRMKVFRHEVSA